MLRLQMIKGSKRIAKLRNQITACFVNAIVAGFFVFFALHGSALAATLRANCSNPSTNLQSVLNSAQSGDTVRVIGTCGGNFQIYGARCITLTGPGTLNGLGEGSVLTVTASCGNSDETIRELKIVNGGNSSLGGGIRFSPTGGGTLTLDKVTVEHNQATNGGGVGVDGTYGGTAILNVVDSKIANNESLATGFGGGGIYNFHGTLFVVDDMIRSNTTLQLGGGIYSLGGSVSIVGSTIRDNRSAGTSGGGAAIWSNSGPMSIATSLVDFNSGNANTIGAITNAGTMTIIASGVVHNSLGGILNSGTLTVADSYVRSNSGGNGNLYNTGSLTLLHTHVGSN